MKATDAQIRKIKWLTWSRAQILKLYVADLYTVTSEKADEVIAELEELRQVRF